MFLYAIRRQMAIPMFVLTLLIVAGCNRTPGQNLPGEEVVITVFYDGQPLTNGQVSLSGSGGAQTIDENGDAKFEKVPYGNYDVIVLPPEPSPIPPEPGQPAPEIKNYPNFPTKYQSSDTSGLQIEVTENETAFSFDLNFE